ncbi:toxin-antitoxin system HicB family antitoxin [Nakamurella antarctica]|uniref:Toxin-antitoxin system HicB family antitoxin n=1 Tax=Nakamurella antarctica TaxID=1902245 RepID=A0A3G8ZLP9_9ACTN|nr:toxin-antitoxin system HicB family antitoxin [Nakamurella antarctica]AZI58078.1 toxin-antitoxin system HicB family antitoxin [Nakamurella antarctica]
MDLSQYTQALRDDLLSAAAAGDETTRHSAVILAAAIEPAARLAILNALADFAGEVTAQLADTSVEVRLQGRDVRVAVERRPSADETPKHEEASTDPLDFSRAFAEAGGDLSRTTVRMFQELKLQAERAANDQGLSLNSFISRAVADSIKGPQRSKDTGRTGKSGSSFTGFIQG